jgi:hypothetical protein
VFIKKNQTMLLLSSVWIIAPCSHVVSLCSPSHALCCPLYETRISTVSAEKVFINIIILFSDLFVKIHDMSEVRSSNAMVFDWE